MSNMWFAMWWMIFRQGGEAVYMGNARPSIQACAISLESGEVGLRPTPDRGLPL